MGFLTHQSGPAWFNQTNTGTASGGNLKERHASGNKLTYAHWSRWSIGHLRPLTIALCSGLLWSFRASWSLAVSALLQCLASNCCETGLFLFPSRFQVRAWRVVLDAGFLRMCPIQSHSLHSICLATGSFPAGNKGNLESGQSKSKVCSFIIKDKNAILFFFYRLVGLVERRPPRERKIPGSNPACAGTFSGSSHTSDLKTGTPVVTLPGAWRYRVSTGTGLPGVSIL